MCWSWLVLSCWARKGNTWQRCDAYFQWLFTITKKTLWIGCCTQLLSQPFVHLDSLDLDLETLRAMIHTTVHYHRLLRYTVLHTTESTLSFRFYSQQGGRTLKDEIFKVQHADFLIFKCFVQLQSLQYQLSNRSSSVWWVMLPSLHDLRLGVSYPHRVVDDVDAARSAFLSVARQCRAAAPAECASKIHGAYVSACMG